MKTTPTQSAFPLCVGDHGEIAEINHGLTKREYFAAIALQALGRYLLDGGSNANEIAKEAVYFADALIEALNTRD